MRIKFHSIKVKNVKSSSKFRAQWSQSSTPGIWSRSLEPFGSNLFGAKAPIWNSLTFSAMKVMQFSAQELSFPFCDIYTRSVLHGEYPDIYKLEVVTPAAKVYPPRTVKDLRKISGTPNFSRIFEQLLAEIMIEDIKPTCDPFGYK